MTKMPRNEWNIEIDGLSQQFAAEMIPISTSRINKNKF